MSLPHLNIEEALDLHQIDRNRYLAVDENVERVCQLLKKTRYDALLLTLPENFAWLTAGGDQRLGHQLTDPLAYVLVSHGGRVILTIDEATPLLFDREISGLGFQLKERLASEGIDELADEMCRGCSVMSDSGLGRTRKMTSEIDQIRRSQSEYSVLTQRQLGEDLEDIINIVFDQIEPGISELDVSILVKVELWKRKIEPLQVQIYADQIHSRYQFWTADETPIQQAVTIRILGKRQGIHWALTKSHSFNTEYNSGEAATTVLDSMTKAMVPHKPLDEVDAELKETLASTDPHGTNSLLVTELGYRYPETILGSASEGKLEPSSCWSLQLRIEDTLLGRTIQVGN